MLARRLRRPSARAVGAVTAAIYVSLLAAAWAGGHGARDFILVGREFADRNGTSDVIRAAHGDVHEIGYDGQFFYYIAIDPEHAWQYTDYPTYRYSRIVYPLAARLLAAGRVDLVPYTLIAINFLAIVIGTIAIAAWLRRRAFSPWYALVYSLFPGLIVAFLRDLAEPLAYGLVALAIYSFSVSRRRFPVAAALLFALAALTKEMTALIAIGYAVHLALSGPESRRLSNVRRNLAPATAFLATALVPMLVFRGLVLALLDSGATTPPLSYSLIPFAGIGSYWPSASGVLLTAVIVAPACLVFLVCLRAMQRRTASVEVGVLAASILALVVFAPAELYPEYFAAGRYSLGVILPLVYCIPQFMASATSVRARSFAAITLWFLPLTFVLPLVSAAKW